MREANLPQEAQRARQICGRELGDRELASWLLFPRAQAAAQASSKPPKSANAEYA